MILQKQTAFKKEMIDMAMTARQEYEAEKQSNDLDVREMVMQAMTQVSEGKIKSFDEVCQRLEKKYTNA